MSQQGSFISGFLFGTVVGGVVGGIVGALAASRLNSPESGSEKAFAKLEPEQKAAKRRQMRASTEQSIETARRGLEDKIAQLNEAIDDVRQQLGTVNGTTPDKLTDPTMLRDR